MKRFSRSETIDKLIKLLKNISVLRILFCLQSLDPFESLKSCLNRRLTFWEAHTFTKGAILTRSINDLLITRFFSSSKLAGYYQCAVDFSIIQLKFHLYSLVKIVDKFWLHCTKLQLSCNNCNTVTVYSIYYTVIVFSNHSKFRSFDTIKLIGVFRQTLS